MAQILKVAAETGDINGLYGSIKKDPNVLDDIDAIPFVDTPLHIAASAGYTDFAIEILRLKPSFGRKLNPDGLSSLHLALKNDKFETVKRLIKFDKELIRVEGREGVNPLHFIAKKDSKGDPQRMDDPINADQQQGGEAHRLDILAEFLFACPHSIEDLTVREETALHIAVKSKNQRAVEVILGCICRIERRKVLAYKDETEKTALDMAVSTSQIEIVSSLRGAARASSVWLMKIARSLCSARALEISSTNPSLAEFLISPERPLEILFKTKILMSKSVSLELRNIGLVVAVLIATATFQAVLSPPGGVGGPGDNLLLTNGSNINATVSSTTNNQFAANTSSINATLFVPTEDPVKRLIFKGVQGAERTTYGYVFAVFYNLNTCAFVLSMLMIMVFLPFRPFSLLHGALFFLMISYGMSFYLISPSHAYSETFAQGSIYCAFLVYFSRSVSFLFEASTERFVGIPMSSVQRKRLQLLERLMKNNFRP